MKRICLSVTGLVAATAAAVSAAFICAGCNDGGVESGGGDAVAFLKHFSDASAIEYHGSSTFTDARDGKTYKKVKIGEQTWMAENLNYVAENGNSRCYNDSDSYCDKYGRLYDWATAMGLDTSFNNEIWDGWGVEQQGVCPDGWHVPSYEEWKTLIEYAGGESSAGGTLKAKTGWFYATSKGTDDFGFSALPGGYGNEYEGIGYFIGGRYYGYWWCGWSGFGLLTYAHEVKVDDTWEVKIYTEPKVYLKSVRCIKNAL